MAPRKFPNTRFDCIISSNDVKVADDKGHIMTVGLTLSLFYLVALVLLIPNIRVSYSVQAELGEQHEHDRDGRPARASNLCSCSFQSGTKGGEGGGYALLHPDHRVRLR